ncbi:hypothetical protein BON22_5347 [Cyberlindnera fabianii]|uniref:Uncharacterized protein n=1 Tax=Cyberlindnera fabianii TaxID=36022 RepID=A0A1V2KYP3_CYBFA|nr:hypothetical protein BON22_5347 [Cyberlindnera fabianii]
MCLCTTFKDSKKAKLSELRTLKKENSLLKKNLLLVPSLSILVSDPETILPNVSGNDGTTSIALFDPVLHSDLDTISGKQFNKNYWKYENVNIMVVWKRIFVCDLLSEDGDAGEHASKSLILGLLAVGSTFAYNKNLIAKGYKCFELAKKYLKTDELWNPTVTTPQTICLLCVFEHARVITEELYYSKQLSIVPLS